VEAAIPPARITESQVRVIAGVTPRRAQFRRLTGPVSKERLDRAFVNARQ